MVAVMLFRHRLTCRLKVKNLSKQQGKNPLKVSTNSSFQQQKPLQLDKADSEVIGKKKRLRSQTGKQISLTSKRNRGLKCMRANKIYCQPCLELAKLKLSKWIVIRATIRKIIPDRKSKIGEIMLEIKLFRRNKALRRVKVQPRDNLFMLCTKSRLKMDQMIAIQCRIRK